MTTMSRRARLVSSLALTLATALWLAPHPALAQLATVHHSPASLELVPQVAAERWILTAVGPDGAVRHEIAAGDDLLLDLSQGADGAWTWELVRIPVVSQGVRDQLAAVRGTPQEESTRQSLEASGQLPAGPFVQTGTFSIVSGVVVFDDQTVEKAAPSEGTTFDGLAAAGAGDTSESGVVAKDVVQADDLIVLGSACVGLDCQNGENFGFDTLRLKENNLRLHFDDTSSSGSFPSTDWRLTANDSNNGGIGRFSIEDATNNRAPFTIQANAPSNSLRIAPSGDLGFGTSTPTLDLHVVEGNTPGLRLEQDGSAGFFPVIWDLAGNEANFFLRETSNGSRLPLRVFPGNPTNTLTLWDGALGVGTDQPAEQVQVVGLGDETGTVQVQNLSTGSAAAAAFTNLSDAAEADVVSHGSGSTATRWGQTSLAGWSEHVQLAGNGIALGTTTDSSLILGTNGNKVIELTGSGQFMYRGQSMHADYVFEAGYDLPTIDEQAAHMWSAKHLPAIGPARVDENGVEMMEIASDRQGIVEELEKAHIYIAQLHERLAEVTDRLDRLESEEVDD
jgi:hypothetical protein